MKTIFGLFTNYEDAQDATVRLLDGPVNEKDINVIVNAEVAKQAMPVNRRTAAVEATDEVGEQTLHGLDALIGRQQPLTIAGVGELFVSGDMATIMARESAQTGNLAATLHDFNVDGEAAQVYSEAIVDGHWLVWVRAADEQAGRVSQIMSACNGRRVANHM